MDSSSFTDVGTDSDDDGECCAGCDRFVVAQWRRAKDVEADPEQRTQKTSARCRIFAGWIVGSVNDAASSA
jgi:hypothetical protein